MRTVLVLCLLVATGCNAVSQNPGGPSVTASAMPPSASPTILPAASPSAIAAASPSVQTALVGKWQLDRTCGAMVRAINNAKHPELIPFVLEELITGAVDKLDPSDPCATAKPPTKHSHTFWPDGRFNSYDENDQQVDQGEWVLVDDHTVKVGDPPVSVFKFSVEGDKLSLAPVLPTDCTSGDCLSAMAWQFAVAFPGEMWTRETAGPHVP